MKRIRRPLCVALFALSFLAHSQELVAILSGDTLDPTVGKSVQFDLRNMKALLQDAAMNAGLRFRYAEISGNGLSKDAVAAQVKTIPFGSDDTVVFYYSGHGYRTGSKAARWPNYGFRGGKETLDSVWVTETLKARKPRLLISLSDCCNVTFEDIYTPRDPAVRSGGNIKAGYAALFMQSSGVIVASSSVPGQPSQGYENGGAFTLQFMEALKNGVRDEKPSWSKVLAVSARRLDFGDGLVQDPQFDVMDAKGILVANEKSAAGGGMVAAVPAAGSGSVTSTSASASTVTTSAIADASSGGWVLLFWFMADCNLEDVMLRNASEIALTLAGTGVDALFFIDRSEGWSNAPLGSIPDWVGAKYVLARDGKFKTLETKGRVNSGNPEVLSDFLSYALRTFPAARTGLFFADHGFGWKGYGGDDSYKADMLTLPELDAACKAALGGKNFSFVAFDACLMGSLETARTFAPYADWFLASEDYVPGHGFDYSALKSVKDASRPTTTVLSDMIASFKAKTEAKRTAQASTLSVIDLSKVGALDAALAAHVMAIRPRDAAARTALSRMRAELGEFGKGAEESQSALSVDVNELLSRSVSLVPEAKESGEKAMAALEAAVVVSFAGKAKPFASGLSLYFPPSKALYDPAYATASPGTSWVSFLDSVLSPGGSGPLLEKSGGQAVYAYDSVSNRPFVGAPLRKERSSDVTAAFLDYGIAIGDGFIMLGRAKAKFTADRAGSFYDGMTATVTQGNVASYAYSVTERTADTVSVTIPFRMYRSPEDASPLSVRMIAVKDVATGRFDYSFWADNASGGVGQVEPDPACVLKPLALAQKKGQSRKDRSWFELKDSFAFRSDLALSFSPLPGAERLRLEISVRDSGGFEDWAGWTEP